MNLDLHSFPADIRRQLQANGCCVHRGAEANRPGLCGRYRSTWCKPGMADAEVGCTCETGWAARGDRPATQNWRELQQFKNLIAGAEQEGFEVYPAESCVANQFHLWVFTDASVRLPVGFREREVMDHEAAAAVGSPQRPVCAEPLTRVDKSPEPRPAA